MKGKRKLIAHSTSDGAGVKLKRVFAYNEVTLMDPFLLLDDFSSHNPDDYIAGFPWHPHRGIITVTYMLEGLMRHEDSLGNKGVIGPGDTQWMRAGRGIIHQEMPEQKEGTLRGLQLWLNLPGAEKMCSPLYQDIKAEQIPRVEHQGGVLRIVAGSLEGHQGPVTLVQGAPFYFDVTFGENGMFSCGIPGGYRSFLYVLEGEVSSPGYKVGKGEALVFDLEEKAGTLEVKSPGGRFLLAGGKPLGEPVAWHGPIVMNTREELIAAFAEYEAGGFIR